MKITNWRRKLAASLIAGGMLAPTALHAANLNTNLVNNPSFENVGPRICCYSATEILGWTDGTQTGFAYHTLQGYDAGGPLSGGGNYYFTANGDDGIEDIVRPGQVSQNINVSTGATATQIAAGEGALRLSAFFTSYLTDGDIGHLHIEYLNSVGGSLGVAEVSARDPSTWRQERAVAFIPVGTATLRASVYGTPVTFGPDGYIDLVDVQVTEAVNELLFLEVNTTTGQVAIKNQTGDPFHIDYYEIVAPGSAARPGDYNDDGGVDAADYTVWRKLSGTNTPLPNDEIGGVIGTAHYNQWRDNFGGSGSDSLDPAGWNSLQEQNLAGFPAGDGTGNGWEVAGGSNGNILSEAYLTANSVVSNGTTINLGAAFNVGSPQNLEFRYAVVPDNGLGQFQGPGEMVQGFVRYVASGGASTAAAPEPCSVFLAGSGLAALAFTGRRTARSTIA